MKLTDDLIKSLSGETPNLTEALMKTKVLLYRLGRKDLAEWVSHELNGYSAETPIPEYRIVHALVKGVVTNGYHRHNSHPLPTYHLEEQERTSFERLEMRESISAIEVLALNDKGKLSKPIPVELNYLFDEVITDGYHVERAWSDIGFGQLGQVITKVRSRLLDFVLELDSKVDDNMSEDEVKKIGQSPETASMFNNAIFGDNVTILVGNQNSQSVSNKISYGDFDALKDLLIKNNLSPTDIQNLESAIHADSPSIEVTEKRFGLKVRGWLKEMLARAIDGSWQIEIGIASNLLTEALKSYYGWQ